jgi:tetratricopeptide (TPR) repeat protein
MASPRLKPLAVALLGAGLAFGSYTLAQDGPGKTSFDPLFDAVANCFKPKQDSSVWMRAVQLAQASPELRPVDAPAAARPAAGPPPLWEGLGTLSYPVTAKNAAAQAYFDQGLRLAYAFNHGEALRAFRHAQQLDPTLAMAHWGEALVLGPNINAPMSADALAPALAALGRARSHLAKASAKEKDLIEALSRRYSADPAHTRTTLDGAYADAMAGLHARYPRDTEIATLYAESLMDLQPWNYWEPGGAKAKARVADVVPVLEKVLKQNPKHPGAIHYYIHAVEASNDPRRAEPHAEKLAALMPGAGHMVHMPSHIYYRVGRYLEALESNRKAVAVDEAYLARARVEGAYVVGYYPHNIHFLMASAQMAGDGRTAVEAAEKLSGAVPDAALAQLAFVHPVKAAPYFAHAQFSGAQTILALPAPSDEFPYVKAMWHYARGVAEAQRKALASAQAEADALARIRKNADFKMLNDGGIPATDVIAVAEHVVHARIAQARGDLAAAAAQLRSAIEIEDKLSYTEPPYWYYPVRQSLGAVLLAAGDLDGAERALRDSLVRTPNNAVALYALAEVHARRGEKSEAAAMRERFKNAWAGEKVDLARL